MGKAKFSVSNSFCGRGKRSYNKSSVNIVLEITSKVIGPKDVDLRKRVMILILLQPQYRKHQPAQA